MDFNTGRSIAMMEYRSKLFFATLTGNGRVLVVDYEPAVRKTVQISWKGQ
jgi:hypothetical protein